MTVKSEHSHVFPECSNVHTEHVSPTRSEHASCTMWLALTKAVTLINSYATLQELWWQLHCYMRLRTRKLIHPCS